MELSTGSLLELSPKTIRNYTCIIDKLKPSIQMLNDMNELKRQIQNVTENIGTQKNYYSAVLWYIKTNAINSTICDDITKEIMRIRKKEETTRERNKMNEKQKDKFIKWTEIINLRDSLEQDRKPEQDAFYVFLCLFTYQPVRRLEDTTLYYYKRKPTSNDKNYIILNKRLGYVVYNVYKTAKNYGQQRYKLTKTLFDIVKTYVKENDIQENTPLFGYTLSNSFGKYIMNQFEQETGKPATINTLRHSYITYLNDKKKISLGRKKQIAQKMGHTFTEQAKYSHHMGI